MTIAIMLLKLLGIVALGVFIAVIFPKAVTPPNLTERDE